MKTLGLQEIEIGKITRSDRLRAVDGEWANAIATSMADTGQHQPITVAKQKTKYRLIDGAHRLEAALRNGRETISATILQATQLEARLLEIDANLIRHELNPLDRATFLSERKAVYEEMFPETKRGAQGGRGGTRNENDTMSFSKSTAEKIGLTPRSIERAVRIHTKLSLDTRSRIAGTAFAAKQNELLALAGHGPEMQERIIDLLLSDAAPPSVKAAVAAIEGHTQKPADPTEQGFQKLVECWRRTNATAQRRFIQHLLDEGYREGNDALVWVADDDEAEAA